MASSLNPRLLSFYTLISRVASSVVLAIGVLVLVGWLFDISLLKSILPGPATMKANTALGFVLGGISLWLSHIGREKRWSQRIAEGCAAFTVLIGVLTLGEYAFRADLGIDQLLFKDTLTPTSAYPGRMSPVSALNLTLIGFALLILDRPQSWWPVQVLMLVVLLISVLALIGYAYGVPSLYDFFPYSSIAIHTALAFLILCVGILFARPERGLMKIFNSDNIGGVVARRLMPAAIVIPFVLGWLLLTGQRMGLYDSPFRFVLFTMSTVIVFALLIWWNAGLLQHTEFVRQQTQMQLSEVQGREAAILYASLDAVITIDSQGRVLEFNPAAEKIFGYERSEAFGREMGELIIPPSSRERHRAGLAKYLETGIGPVFGKRLELTGMRADGTEFPVELTITPITGSEQPIFTGFVRDITERKQAENALRESETRYRSMFEFAAVSIWEEDFTEVQAALDGLKAKGVREFHKYFSEHPEFVRDAIAAVKVLDVNEQSLKLFGVASKDELLGSLDQTFLPETRAAFAEELAALAEGRKYYEGEVTIQTLQGERREVLISIHFPETGEQLNRTLVSLMDITERKRAESLLREGERYAYSLLNLSKRLEQAQTYADVLDAALGQVRAILGYQNVWTYLLSEDRQSFRLLTSTGELSQKITDDLPTLPVKGDRFLEEIAEGKDIVLVEDARTDPRTNKEIVALLGNRTIVNVPIMLMDRHLGTFGTGSFGEEGVRVPTPAQLEYLRSLASHMAVTLDRIHLLIERKKVEEALSASETKFRTLFETMSEGFSINEILRDESGKPRDSRYLEVNPAFERYMGLKAADTLGRTLLELFPGTEPIWIERYGKVALSGEPAHFEARFGPLGRWFEVHAYQTEPGRFAVVFFDISDRKEAEQALQQVNEELERKVQERTAQLQESEEKFSKAFLASPAAVSIASLPDGRYINVNESLVRLTGYSKEELIGHTPDELGLVDSAGRAKILEAIEKHGVARDVEIQIRTKSNEVAEVLTSIEQFELNGRPCLLSVNFDITERKRAEVALQKTKIELEATNKELEAFSYSVSHDLRAPLRSIDGYSQAVLEDYGDVLPPEGQTFLKQVRRSAHHMAELIDDLLKLSQVTRAQIKSVPVDLTKLAENTLAELGRTHPERRVRTRVAPNLKARGDSHLLQIVLENLLNNAWKYTSKREQAEIEFGSKQENGQTIFFVRDNGAGFDMTYAGKLFGAFQRLHTTTEFPGTGIGLATVNRIVQRHGGRIWAESVVDQGATFFFTLPAWEVPKARPERKKEDSIIRRAKEII